MKGKGYKHEMILNNVSFFNFKKKNFPSDRAIRLSIIYVMMYIIKNSVETLSKNEFFEEQVSQFSFKISIVE